VAVPFFNTWLLTTEIPNLRSFAERFQAHCFSHLSMRSMIGFPRWSLGKHSYYPIQQRGLANIQRSRQSIRVNVWFFSYISCHNWRSFFHRCSCAPDVLECLRQVDSSILNQASVNIANSSLFGTCIFVPVVDGKLITKRPTELLREGKLNGVRLFLSSGIVYILISQ